MSELARYGICVGVVVPGFIETDMTASMRQEMLDKLAAGVLLGRLGQPEDIVESVAFIMTNDSIPDVWSNVTAGCDSRWRLPGREGDAGRGGRRRRG